MNGKAIVEPITVEKNYYEARVKGVFQKNMDFRNYLFEKILLTVEIEGLEDMSLFEFIPNHEETWVDDLVNIPGWNLKSTNSEVFIHKYSDGAEFPDTYFHLILKDFSYLHF